LFDTLQTFENAALRTFLKLDQSVEGVIVHAPRSADPGYPLKKWDVIAKIGGIPIDNQGNGRLDDTLKIGFGYFIQKSVNNGIISLTVMRGGVEKQIQMPVSLRPRMLIQPLKGEYPSYFLRADSVFGGFKSLTR
jgi:hypothetical protein